MRDLQPCSGCLGHCYRLVDAVEQAGGLVAHVGGVDATGVGYEAYELDHLVDAGVPAGLICQAAGHADHASLERLGYMI